MTTVVVSGGRDFTDREFVFAALDALHDGERGPITLLVEGGAVGCDHLAWEWAQESFVPARRVRARWTIHGKRAGPIRNQEMLDAHKPDIAVIFPGGPGTADMLARCEKLRAAGALTVIMPEYVR